MLETIFFKIQFDQSTNNFDKCKIILVFEFSSTIFCFKKCSTSCKSCLYDVDSITRLCSTQSKTNFILPVKLAPTEHMANHTSVKYN